MKFANKKGVQRHLVQQSKAVAEIPGTEEPEPVDLLWVDVEANYRELQALWGKWRDHVGRYVAIAGLDEKYRLGSRRICSDIQGDGWIPILREQPWVACFLKPEPRERAVFYIASDRDNGRFVREACRSAGSVKEHLRLPTHLFLSGNAGDIENIDYVHELPRQQGPLWYLNSVRYFNHAVEELAGYQELLYLDTDTYICRPCLDLFHVLRAFDLALGHSPQRDAIETAIGTPASFSTHQVGVNVFQNTPAVRAFLGRWLERYESAQDIYDDNDQASLRDCLFKDRSVRFCTLAPEYCLRFDFSAWVVGWVRILHGRVGGISETPLQPVCDEINQHCRMRVWRHGLLT